VARVVWKGAITFGLIHIPVSLYPGSTSSTLDFDQHLALVMPVGRLLVLNTLRLADGGRAARRSKAVAQPRRA
jgi:non-homologous end joining protein Ku